MLAASCGVAGPSCKKSGQFSNSGSIRSCMCSATGNRGVPTAPLPLEPPPALHIVCVAAWCAPPSTALGVPWYTHPPHVSGFKDMSMIPCIEQHTICRWSSVGTTINVCVCVCVCVRVRGWGGGRGGWVCGCEGGEGMWCVVVVCVPPTPLHHPLYPSNHCPHSQPPAPLPTHANTCTCRSHRHAHAYPHPQSHIQPQPHLHIDALAPPFSPPHQHSHAPTLLHTSHHHGMGGVLGCEAMKEA